MPWLKRDWVVREGCTQDRDCLVRSGSFVLVLVLVFSEGTGPWGACASSPWRITTHDETKVGRLEAKGRGQMHAPHLAQSRPRLVSIGRENRRRNLALRESLSLNAV